MICVKNATKCLKLHAKRYDNLTVPSNTAITIKHSINLRKMKPRQLVDAVIGRKSSFAEIAENSIFLIDFSVITIVIE